MPRTFRPRAESRPAKPVTVAPGARRGDRLGRSRPVYLPRQQRRGHRDRRGHGARAAGRADEERRPVEVYSVAPNPPSWPDLFRPSTWVCHAVTLRGPKDVDARNKCRHDDILVETSYPGLNRVSHAPESKMAGSSPAMTVGRASYAVRADLSARRPFHFTGRHRKIAPSNKLIPGET